MKEIFLDTTQLEPPAPMQLVLSELQTIIPSQSYLHQVHRLEPLMVLNRLDAMGIEYLIKKEGKLYHIYYFYPQDREKVKRLIDV